MEALMLSLALMVQQQPTTIDINVHHGHWYASPVWIAIIAIAVVVVLMLLIMATRSGGGGGTTIVRD
jgi:hypothetical protein